MCQLLGISANKEVDISLSLREFRHRGEENYHGWGFAFLENMKWEVIKKPSSLANEDINKNIFCFKSKIIIGHVRLASCGSQVHKNTHPFAMSNWAFAHNGTVKDIKKIHLNKFYPLGDTDSEYAFCYILEKLQSITSSQVAKIISEEAMKIKNYGRFNFIMSDGKRIYAYGDDSLYYVERKAPFNSIRLIDDQYEVNLSDIKAPDEKAVIVATKPLTKNENWIKISGLKIFENGMEIC